MPAPFPTFAAFRKARTPFGKAIALFGGGSPFEHVEFCANLKIVGEVAQADWSFRVMPGGCRLVKSPAYTLTDWDFLPLPMIDDGNLLEMLMLDNGLWYDYTSVFNFVVRWALRKIRFTWLANRVPIPFIGYFCSAMCCRALVIFKVLPDETPQLQSPGELYDQLKEIQREDSAVASLS